jgi:hypothetical protein
MAHHNAQTIRAELKRLGHIALNYAGDHIMYQNGQNSLYYVGRIEWLPEGGISLTPDMRSESNDFIATVKVLGRHGSVYAL